MSGTLSDEQVETIREALALIHAEVSALCSGEKRWTMHIPADPKRDSDLIISGAAFEALAALASRQPSVAKDVK